MFFIKYLLINSLIFICLNSNGQNIPDTINRFNNNGKRTGYWIEYVNETLEITKKKKSVFYRYVLYENGLRIGDKLYNFKKLYLIVNGNQPQEDKTVLLNGVYRLYNKNGKLSCEQYYKEGILLSSKTFFTNGQVYEYIDYSDQYKGQKGSYSITIYKKEDTSLVEEQYYFGKKDDKWKLINK